MVVPRPVLTVTLTVGLLAASLAAQAQPSPKVTRVGVLDAGSAVDSSARIESLRTGLRELGHAEGQTPMLYTHRRRLADLAVRNRLAWIAGDREYAEAGCLMSFGANGNDLVRRAATYVDRVLKGAKPADLPIEQPTRFELVVNLKTARALGLTIPPSVLVRVDQVIE